MGISPSIGFKGIGQCNIATACYPLAMPFSRFSVRHYFGFGCPRTQLAVRFLPFRFCLFFSSKVPFSVRMWAWDKRTFYIIAVIAIARNNKKRRRQPKGKYYNFYYVTWLGVVFGVGVGNSSLLF
jgi:hypothetical protein